MPVILRTPAFKNARDHRVYHALTEGLPALRGPVALGVMRRQRFAVEVVEVMHHQRRFIEVIARRQFKHRHLAQGIHHGDSRVAGPRVVHHIRAVDILFDNQHTRFTRIG